MKNKYKNRKRAAAAVVCLLVCSFLSLAGSAKEGSIIASLVRDGDVLMKKRELKSYEEALDKYKKALAQSPDDIDIMIKTANALNHIIRVKTMGNIILFDGSTQDTEENKKIWRELGAEAARLAEKGVKERPGDPFAAVVNAESYMYYMSSFGVLKAIFDGAVGQYKKNARVLLDCAEETIICGSTGDIYMGVFYLITPWPLSDYKESKKHFLRALELEPLSLSSHYNIGVHAVCTEDYKTALKEFGYVINNPCDNGQEADYCGFLKGQAEKGISFAEKMIKEN